jgi:hypothetical protein
VRLTQTLSQGIFSLQGVNRAASQPALFFSQQARFSLAPLPARDVSHLSYTLSASSLVEVRIYTMRGELVSGIQPTVQEHGLQTTQLRTEHLSSGAYTVFVLVNGLPTGNVQMSVIH